MQSWPLQLLIVALPEGESPAGLLGLLQASRANGVIRLIDGGIVRKGEDGDLSTHRVQALEFDDDPRNGKLAGLLFGCDAAGRVTDASIEAMCQATAEPHVFGLSANDLAEIADGIPRASDALVLLVEHRWTVGFAESVDVQQGTLLAHGSIVPQTIIEICGSRGMDSWRP